MSHFVAICLTLPLLGLAACGAVLAAGETAPSKAPAPQPQSQPQPILLWPNGAPEAKGETDRDKPSITPYFPAGEGKDRPAVVICPGGGYSSLMTSYEGTGVAKWLNSHGVVGIVLKYRIGPYRHPAPMLDGQRAMRLVRSKAAEWGIDPKKIGIMGFSAGGHLASTVGTHFDAGNPKAADPVDRESCRPDFMVLVYPVITMGPKGHAGSRAALLGAKPSEADIELLSNEKQVTAETPPTFLAHAVTDKSVPIENSRMFHEALKSAKVPSELLELPEGAHGLGCGSGKLWAEWQARCLEWMKAREIVKEAK
jgi:acetyl esterase/lipase